MQRIGRVLNRFGAFPVTAVAEPVHIVAAGPHACQGSAAQTDSFWKVDTIIAPDCGPKWEGDSQNGVGCREQHTSGLCPACGRSEAATRVKELNWYRGRHQYNINDIRSGRSIILGC